MKTRIFINDYLFYNIMKTFKKGRTRKKLKEPDYCFNCGLYMNTLKKDCENCQRLKDILSGVKIEKNMSLYNDGTK